MSPAYWHSLSTLKIVNSLPLVASFLLLMHGYKIQCKNNTFGPYVSGSQKAIFQRNGGFVLILKL